MSSFVAYFTSISIHTVVLERNQQKKINILIKNMDFKPNRQKVETLVTDSY